MPIYKISVIPARYLIDARRIAPAEKEFSVICVLQPGSRKDGVGDMFVSNVIGRNDMYRIGGRAAQTAAPYDNWMNATQSADAAKTAAEKKRMLARDGRDGQEMTASRSIVEDSFSYSESLRKTRTEKKSTQQKLKKLHYSFKSISSQLLQCKTSMDAARVVRKARRQVVSLQGKRLYENAKYDNSELDAALTHAKAMLLVARKKVKHLQEEEMAKVHGGICEGSLEENKERENELAEEEKAALEQLSANGGNRSAKEDAGDMFFSQDDAMLARQEWIQAYEEAMSQSGLQEMAVSMNDAMEDFADEMSDSMRELLEEMGLSELAESTSGVKVDMDPADYKQMKLKHRLEEMRAIALADAKYLKAMFNRMEKARESAAQAVSGRYAEQNGNGPAIVGASSSGGMVIAANGGAASAHMIDYVSTPDAASAVAAVPVEGGSVDVSV